MLEKKLKILTVVYDNIYSDPRASKFRETLIKKHDVYTLSIGDKEGASYNQIKEILLKGHNKIFELFYFWYCVINYVGKIKPDVILSHNYFTALPCWIASKYFGIPLLYDAYEFYVPEKGKKFPKRNFFFFLNEKFVSRRAELVFAANPERARLMKSAFGLRKRPIAILNIPIYQNPGIVKASIDIRNDEVKLVYEGFIVFSRFVDLLINSLEYLPENFKLIIIGDGPDVVKMKDLINSKSYKKRIDYMGRIDGRLIIPTLSDCHIGFVGYPFTNLNNKYCSPNKIYEYPAAGIPFVSSSQTSIWEITKKYHICNFYNYKEGAKGVANAIMDVAVNYTNYVIGIESFNANNTWSSEANKIIESLQCIKL